MASKIENIKKNLEDESFDVRKKAVRDLARQDSVESVELLIDCLADDNADVAAQAVKGLSEKGESAIPALIEALKNTIDGVIRGAISFHDVKIISPLNKKTVEA